MSDGERPLRGRLRRKFRARRRSLSTTQQTAHATAVAGHFCAAGLHLRGRTVGAYVAADGELSPAPLVTRLLAMGKHLALPVVHRNGRMDFRGLDDATPMVRNRFGIPEPAPGSPVVPALRLDVLLMPLVAFDDAGTRLGMGAGFYDRFLARLPDALRPRLIGLAHEIQRSADPLPEASWDVPLDGVITEAGWHRFPPREDTPWP